MSLFAPDERGGSCKRNIAALRVIDLYRPVMQVYVAIAAVVLVGDQRLSSYVEAKKSQAI
ncbi:MAG: hypothetical protein H7Z11_18625 [Verrucomicrobia bacterium]|nr:hypothetical protein [Leptolyngbya sp. ES-bin-22]